MTVRDLLKMEVDVDCYDDVQDGIGIAFCGPMGLTAEGEQKFAGALDLPVKLDLENNEAIICIDDESDAVWKARYRQAKDFFYSAAGYCADEDWNKWFKYEWGDLEGKRKLRYLTSDEIDKICDEHELWVDTGGKDGKHADFHNCDLYLHNFSGRRLVGVDFSGSEVSGCNFSDCNLTRANFTDADAYQTKFYDSTLDHAKFIRADVSGAKFYGANCRSMDLSLATAAKDSPVKFGDADLTDAYVFGAKLGDAELENYRMNKSHRLVAEKPSLDDDFGER